MSRAADDTGTVERKITTRMRCVAKRVKHFDIGDFPLAKYLLNTVLLPAVK